MPRHEPVISSMYLEYLVLLCSPENIDDEMLVLCPAALTGSKYLVDVGFFFGQDGGRAGCQRSF